MIREDYAAMELRQAAKDGVIPPAQYLSDDALRAARLFEANSEAGLAALLATAVPRSVDYLEQAPAILALASMGVENRTRVARKRIVEAFKRAIETAPSRKLRDVLSRFSGAPTPLRKLAAGAVSIEHFRGIEALCGIEPSPLSQAIPADVGVQRDWIKAVHQWSMHLARRAQVHVGEDRRREFISWFASALTRDLAVAPPNQPRITISIIELADFAVERPDTWNFRWGIQQAADAAHRWHEEIAKMNAEESYLAKHGLGWEDPIPYEGLPVEIVIDGLTFVALRSGADLFREGQAMRHCVATYARSVIAGQSRIYGIRSGEKRIATLELQDLKREVLDGRFTITGDASGNRFAPVQLKGPRNTDPGIEVLRATNTFVKKISEGRADG